MTLAQLTNTCPACGAEESLDALIMRMVDDDQVRRLIADILTVSLALGSLALRYLRLHKPAKQKLRMERVAAVLGELLPDVQRHAITRKGREWAVPVESWKLGFQAVFEAAEKGTLKAPLDGNAYLYEVLMRMADKAEAEAERGAEAKRRQQGRSYSDSDNTGGGGQAKAVASVLPGAAASTPATPANPTAPRPLTAPPAGPSLYARQVAAQNAARQAALRGETTSTTGEQ